MRRRDVSNTGERRLDHVVSHICRRLRTSSRVDGTYLQRASVLHASAFSTRLLQSLRPPCPARLEDACPSHRISRHLPRTEPGISAVDCCRNVSQRVHLVGRSTRRHDVSIAGEHRLGQIVPRVCRRLRTSSRVDVTFLQLASGAFDIVSTQFLRSSCLSSNSSQGRISVPLRLLSSPSRRTRLLRRGR